MQLVSEVFTPVFSPVSNNTTMNRSNTTTASIVNSEHPRVTFDPFSRLWVLARSNLVSPSTIWNFELYNAALNRVDNTTASFGSAPNHAVSLACPNPVAAPVVHYAMEDRPGARGFADQRELVPLGCTGAQNCPVAGAVGASPPSGSQRDNEYGEVILPPTDTAYALNFDGENDTLIPSFSGNRGNVMINTLRGDHTISFWMNTTEQASVPAGARASAGIHLFEALGAGGTLIAHGNGQILVDVNTTTARGPASINVSDGRWHFISVVRSGNQIQVYVDGLAGQAATFSGTNASAGSYTIGNRLISGNAFQGRLDDLKIYASGFSADIIRRILNGEVNPVCRAAVPLNSRSSEIIDITQPDLTSVLLEGRDQATLVIDTAAPQSELDSVTDGGYVQGSPDGIRSFIIGGTAIDTGSADGQVPGSGIARVEVSVNSGVFQPAGGAKPGHMHSPLRKVCTPCKPAPPMRLGRWKHQMQVRPSLWMPPRPPPR
ncbi:MAG: LamG domain-containing protein [Chloroflexaceae bacterium]|nr:LamG domain-containing protein [Chloroflexaceae bacterium]